MRRMTIAAAAFAMALTACSSASGPTTTLGSGRGGATIGGGGQVGLGTAVQLINGALARFDACDDFLRHVKAEAKGRVGPYGLDWYYGSNWRWPTFGALDGDASTTAAPAQSEGVDRNSYSATNNQEAGVDEPDMVKTDGERIVALTGNVLRVVELTKKGPKLVGTLPLSPNQSVSDLFLHGDKVILLGNSWGDTVPFPGPAIPIDATEAADAIGGIAPDEYFPGTPVVTLTEVDISGAPMIIRTLQLDGSYVNSRLIDNLARIVFTSGPSGFVWEYPQGSGLRAERAAIAANKKIIEESTIENWVPYFLLRDADGEIIDEGPAISCDRAHHPAQFAGFNMLSVATLDLDQGLELTDSTGVLATGETLYASTNSIYIATNGWFEALPVDGAFSDEDVAFAGQQTQIHQFDISTSTTNYVATGAVDGYLLNQFAMSEHNGDLRVASTTSPNWWGRGRQNQQSMVSVLRPNDGELELIGQVDGLGKDEQIYSVRFLGDVAYLVTFRQIDPLFTIDLSDPTEPVVRGELKIPGYSSYLHVVSDNLVLGIGQDATDNGRVQGSQASLFDVSDLDNPRRVAQLTLAAGGNSLAEYDHRAFLLWDDMVVLPITEYDYRSEDAGFFTGAVAIEVGTETLTKITRLSHPDATNWDFGWDSTIVRSLVVGDSLYTVSNRGLMESDLNELDELSWISFETR